MQPQADSGLTEDVVFQIDSLSCLNSPGIAYLAFKRDNPQEYTTTSFQCILKFISKELDPSTGRPEEEGYEDEYQLEDVELSAGGDYIIPSYASFSSEWDRLRSGASATETFSLGAMESIKGTFGLSVLAMNLSTSTASSLHPSSQLPATRSLSYSIWSLWVARRRRVRRLYTRCNFLGW